jgi:hypothetical protein
MTTASPLRGPESPEGGGFAAAHLLARRAGYGAAPPAPRLLRIACGDGLRPTLTPETTAAPGARKSGQAQACPRAARGAQTPAVAGHRTKPDARATSELAFDSHKKRENYKPRVVSRIK